MVGNRGINRVSCPNHNIRIRNRHVSYFKTFSKVCCGLFIRDSFKCCGNANSIICTFDGLRQSDLEGCYCNRNITNWDYFLLLVKQIYIQRFTKYSQISKKVLRRDRRDYEENFQVSQNVDETPSTLRFEKLVLEKIHQEMRVFADNLELMRRELSEIKVQLAEFRGESKGKGKLEDGLDARVKILEDKVEELRMFKVKVAAYGALGGVVFGSISAAIVNGVMRGFGSH